MDWRLVTSDAELQALLKRVQQCEAVALDTEFMRRNTFYPQIALLQLYAELPEGGDNVAWLIDPLAIEDISGIKALFQDDSTVKVLHSASEDLEVFNRWLGVLPRPLFDTQKAAALLGMGFGMGYRSLVERMCGVDLPKGETQSNWLQRPLTESQCDYAAQDVIYLWSIYKDLRAQALELGKWDWIADAGELSVTSAQPPMPPYYPRVKGASTLDRRQLGALAAICTWREETARDRDTPRGWIIDDATCLNLAQADPASWDDLSRVSELPRQVQKRYGESLLQLLEGNRGVQEPELPTLLPRPLAARQRSSVKKLKVFARDLAEQLGVAPEILVQSKDYELLIREAEGESISQPGHWSGWRKELVLEPLRERLSEMGA
jgi:ribonuclease D